MATPATSVSVRSQRPTTVGDAGERGQRPESASSGEQVSIMAIGVAAVNKPTGATHRCSHRQTPLVTALRSHHAPCRRHASTRCACSRHRVARQRAETHSREGKPSLVGPAQSCESVVFRRHAKGRDPAGIPKGFVMCSVDFSGQGHPAATARRSLAPTSLQIAVGTDKRSQEAAGAMCGRGPPIAPRRLWPAVWGQRRTRRR